VVPLVTIVVAIGMTRFLPQNTTTPLFANEETATKFFQQHRISIPPKVPLVLAGVPCSSCTTLKAELSAAGIEFIEQDPGTNAAAQSLFEAAKKATGTTHLPQVIIGTKVVKADVRVIKSELGR
jgi:glutaredoxin